jgi:hypothetical protein
VHKSDPAHEIATRLHSSEFDAFFNAAPGSPDRFPVASLDDADRALFGTTASQMWLSRTSLDEHRARHPETGIEDYRQIPLIIRNGTVYASRQKRFVLLWLGARAYRAAIKVDATGNEMWFLSLLCSTKQKPPKGAVLLR